MKLRLIVILLALNLLGATQVSLVSLAHETCPKFGVDPEIALKVMRVESDCQIYALGVQIRKQHYGYFPEDASYATVLLDELLTETSNVGIGVMQINWHWWGNALDVSPSDLLEPDTNILVGCALLGRYLEGSGSITEGIGRYHSSTPELLFPYANRIQEAKPCQN